MATSKPPIFRKLKYFAKREQHADGWSEVSPASREWEDVYRRRWQHDKVVRSTHGVNCTGSCSWQIFVKDGIVTWENQATDYPSTGPDMPDFEPRGCPRGASFSWYLYSPLRVKYPYVRSVLLQLWRDAVRQHADPVQAWASIAEDPATAKLYKSARGKGGLVRASWEEVTQIISASMIHTIRRYGPDRVVGFSPIPAMSMVSYAAGSRFLSLIGAPLLSFYDWYADLPPASPQIWGDQTDVPESSDWFNSGYILVWGSNLPMTRTPDAHFLAEARYRGTKVVSISPDYAEYVKFADTWMSVRPGTDGALAMAMGHVILQQFYVDQPTDSFIQYAKQYTDFPNLVIINDTENGFTPGRFLTAEDLGAEGNNMQWKTVVYDDNNGSFAVPNGSLGFRWGEDGRWNLHMTDHLSGTGNTSSTSRRTDGIGSTHSTNDIVSRYGDTVNADGTVGADSSTDDTSRPIDPRLSLLGIEHEVLTIKLPYFDDNGGHVMERVVPVKHIISGGKQMRVTTVYDLVLAKYGVDRGLGDAKLVAASEETRPFTPAWQEKITGVPRETAERIAQEFARNAIETKGRSMIIMGAGINHWYNSDVIYRAIINLVVMTGCQGVNGGGWAHYVGQEKLRPAEGWQTIAFARDWTGPARLQNGTSFFYFATDQWRYEETPISELISPLAKQASHIHNADYNVQAVRLGWLPSYPQFNRNSLELCKDARQAGATTRDEISAYVAEQLNNRSLQFSIEDPDDPINHPRVLFVWRANLISSSGKGHEYFLKHLLGASNGLLGDDSASLRPDDVVWHEEAPEGKLDLLVDLDFRMAGTALYSDIVLPAATWYEKSDLSSTDMHPFVHPFNPAVSPQWESRSDWDIFKELARSFSEMAAAQFTEPQQDIVATPLLHDSPDELAQPYGRIRDWSKGEIEPVPGKTMPHFHVVERDYAAVYEKMVALGPNVRDKPIGTKGITWSAAEEYERLQRTLGVIDAAKSPLTAGCPDIGTDRNVAEAILMLSSTTNGKMAVRAWESLEKKTALHLKDLAEERAEECFTFDEITSKPRTVITSPAFSGSEKGGRRYSPFTTNIERLIPWRTLTGRQQFYVDHQMLQEFGETLATFKPTLKHKPFLPGSKRPAEDGKEIVLNYLTPHNKWSVHSMYYDSLPMLTLFRGGPTIWLNHEDAADTQIADNDWIECFNRNGVVVARAVVSHRIPRGMAFMHHAQDRHINVPGTPISGTRGGTHNSPTRIHMKPTHMIGGYAQLSYGFNYYGPTGNQRDLNVIIRKLQEVDWLEN